MVSNMIRALNVAEAVPRVVAAAIPGRRMYLEFGQGGRGDRVVVEVVQAWAGVSVIVKNAFL